jgi:hypothetical protein
MGSTCGEMGEIKNTQRILLAVSVKIEHWEDQDEDDKVRLILGRDYIFL